MHGILRGGRGRRLDPAGYAADFDERFWRIGGEGFWKLERGQYFQEPGVDSWEMARDGDWAGSMELVESRRDAFGGHLARISAAGFSHHRVLSGALRSWSDGCTRGASRSTPTSDGRSPPSPRPRREASRPLRRPQSDSGNDSGEAEAQKSTRAAAVASGRSALGECAAPGTAT